MDTKVLKGHKSRGEEIFELLQMLGGKNTAGLKNTFTGFYYWINEDNEITVSDMLPSNATVYSLEDFKKEYPFKVGDLVRYFPHKVSVIKSMFISYDGDIKYRLEEFDDIFFQAHQLEYVGQAEYYQMNENVKSSKDVNLQQFEKQLDEALEKETKESLEKFFFGEPEPKAPILSNRYDYADGKCGYVIPDGYEFDYIKDGFQKEIIIKPIVEHKSHQTDIDAEQENTKTSFTFDCIRNEKGENQLIIPSHLEVIIEDGIYILREKKPQYPKTYEECCEVLGISRHDVEIDLPHPYQQKMFNLFKLHICRDAYWKIAGDEMGLEKPWKPDWRDSNFKYCLKKMGDNIEKFSGMTICCILSFPTEEMRDAFYENFKDLIEQCKELL